MKQVVQPLGGGPVQIVDVPKPVIGATEVLVQTTASLVSAGTERALTHLAQSSLLAKARARPDLTRQVIRKARSEGVTRTVHTVRNRLCQDMPLGYSAAGIAVEVGEAVAGIAPGQLVATGGAGKANHAEWQAVAGLLCCAVPAGVSAEQAAFATVGSIALHSVRLAGVGPGADVAVVGLGLVGQLAARLALAAGCRVIGLDMAPFPIERAATAGVYALRDDGDSTTEAVWRWTRNRGVDAVIIAAADKSSTVIRRVPALCREQATVVVVGDVGLDLERTPFYDKELVLRVARAYGPGRYDRSYEEWGVDYPIGHVRWTEGRNQQAILDLIANERLQVEDLITHRIPIAQAIDAYELFASRAEPYLGIVLTYPSEDQPSGPIKLRGPTRSRDKLGVGLVGAGAFAGSVLVPALKHAGFDRFVAVASSSGLSARRLGEQAGFERAVSGADAVIEDPDVGVVVVTTPHNTHADFVVKALRAGKHVWCEKPLALTQDELDEIEAAFAESGSVLYVGFNRRASPAVQDLSLRLDGTGPLVIDYRVSAGLVSPEHWYANRLQGGRLVGEMCHFVDTCAAIAGPISEARALGSIAGPELALAESFVVSLRHDDGSLSTIAYAANGHPGTEKERIEILGGGHTATIADFRTVIFDGQTTRLGGQDKGHRTLTLSFHEAVLRGEASQVGVESSRWILRAAASLRR